MQYLFTSWLKGILLLLSAFPAGENYTVFHLPCHPVQNKCYKFPNIFHCNVSPTFSFPTLNKKATIQKVSSKKKKKPCFKQFRKGGRGVEMLKEIDWSNWSSFCIGDLCIFCSIGLQLKWKSVYMNSEF